MERGPVWVPGTELVLEPASFASLNVTSLYVLPSFLPSYFLPECAYGMPTSLFLDPPVTDWPLQSRPALTMLALLTPGCTVIDCSPPPV